MPPVNPYEAIVPAAAPPARRFRWRTIPVAVLAFVGLVAYVGAANVLLSLLLLSPPDSPDLQRRLTVISLSVGLLAAGIGSALLLAAWFLWRGSWIAALVAVGAAILIGVVGDRVLFPMLSPMIQTSVSPGR